MKNRKSLLTAAVAALLASLTAAQEIDVYLSVKYIADGSGAKPPGTYSDPAALVAAVDQMNEGLARWGRGYRYVLLETETILGASQFFDLDDGESAILEAAAKASPAAYAWRTYAVNVYVVNDNPSGGSAAIPSSDGPQEIVVMVAGVTPATTWPHELGHHYDLIHTFGSGGLFGDDGLADTKPDPAVSCEPPTGGTFSCTVGSDKQECCCQTKIGLLEAKGYSEEDHDALLYNLMGYYGANDCVGLISPPIRFDTVVLTDQQLDRWSDATRKYAWLQGEVSGFTFFVDRAFGGTSTGYSTSPYKTVASGLSAAAAGNGKILLIRGGSYPEPMTISTPITLRASKGAVTLGP